MERQGGRAFKKLLLPKPWIAIPVTCIRVDVPNSWKRNLWVADSLHDEVGAE